MAKPANNTVPPDDDSVRDLYRAMTIHDLRVHQQQIAHELMTAPTPQIRLFCEHRLRLMAEVIEQWSP